MAGFLVRRSHVARELQARDAELAKRAASALLTVDDGIRSASDEVCFAEAELGAESIDGAWAVIAAVRRRLTDAFRLNRLNHDAMPGTPDEVRARDVLIVRLCEWAESVLEQLTSALAERVARARRVPIDLGEIRADVASRPPGPIDVDGVGGVDGNAAADVRTDPDTDPNAHVLRLREARAALDAATAAAHEVTARGQRSTPPAQLLQHAIERADRTLGAARDAVTDHRGLVGAEAQIRLAEAERIRADLRFCLGSSGATATVIVLHEGQRAQALTMTRSVASLAAEALHLARRDLDASRRQRAALGA